MVVKQYSWARVTRAGIRFNVNTVLKLAGCLTYVQEYGIHLYSDDIPNIPLQMSIVQPYVEITIN